MISTENMIIVLLQSKPQNEFLSTAYDIVRKNNSVKIVLSTIVYKSNTAKWKVRSNNNTSGYLVIWLHMSVTSIS